MLQYKIGAHKGMAACLEDIQSWGLVRDEMSRMAAARWHSGWANVF